MSKTTLLTLCQREAIWHGPNEKAEEASPGQQNPAQPSQQPCAIVFLNFCVTIISCCVLKRNFYLKLNSKWKLADLTQVNWRAWEEGKSKIKVPLLFSSPAFANQMQISQITVTMKLDTNYRNSQCYTERVQAQTSLFLNCSYFTPICEHPAAASHYYFCRVACSFPFQAKIEVFSDQVRQKNSKQTKAKQIKWNQMKLN